MPLLHLAVGLSENSSEIVYVLLEKGGNPNSIASEEKVSPMHLSVMFDYENVLQALIQFGGDPKLVNGDNKSCYDLAKENVESEMKEKCFLYFYKRCTIFRKSIKPSDSVARIWRDTHSQSLSLTSTTLSEGFITCESDFEAVSIKSEDEDQSKSKKIIIIITRILI